MDVLFLQPCYPPEMPQYVRGLQEVGARVHGVGDTPLEAMAPELRRRLSSYLQVPSLLDEDDVVRRVLAYLDGRRPDRVESCWEFTVPAAARLRAQVGAPGNSPAVTLGFRDKAVMGERLAAAGLRVPRTARARTADEAWKAAEYVGFPLCYKPSAGAGGADTHRVDHPAQLAALIGGRTALGDMTLQEWLVGAEYTYETLCVDGQPVLESVCRYEPNVLDARRNEWISPIIATEPDLSDPRVRGGVALGRQVLRALGMTTGFTHMEWWLLPNGEAVFGEVACRPPGANMVDLMNYAGDCDLFREWARVVCWGSYQGPAQQRYAAAIVFKRAQGQGRIRRVVGLDSFLQRFGPHVARVDLLPVGAPRRDWTRTFLSDGNLVVRHPSREAALRLARAVTTDITLLAG